MSFLLNPYIYAASAGNLPSTLLDDLISWWEMEEASGNARVDSHGDNDLSENGATGSKTGKIGDAVDISGTGENLYVAAAGSGMNGTGSFTIAGWVSFDSLAAGSGHEFVMCHADDSTTSNNQLCWAIYCPTASKLPAMSVWVGTTDYTATYSGSAISTGTAYFFVGYYDADNDEVGISINGGAFDTAAVTGTINSAKQQIKFGRLTYGQAWNHWFNGWADEWGYWDRVITTDEVAELYNSGAGIGYDDIALADWRYPTVDAAESSGDSWVNGDIIRITDPHPAVEFVYWSDWAVNGHSGLLPRYPFGDSQEITPTLVQGEGPGSDPDPDWSWNKSVVGGTFTGDENAGNWRLNHSGGSWAHFYAPDNNPTTAMGVFRNLKQFVRNSGGGGVDEWYLRLHTVGATNYKADIGSDSAQFSRDFHVVVNAGSIDLNLAETYEFDPFLMMFVQSDKVAYWDGSTLLYSGTPATSVTNDRDVNFYLNERGVQGTAMLYGTFV